MRHTPRCRSSLGVIRMGSLAALFVAIVMSHGLAAPTGAASKADPVVIRPDPLKINPGEPLSPLTLVAQPTPVKGARSWTLETPRHRGFIYAMALSPDGSQLATGGIDGMVRIWSVETGRQVRVLVGHASYVFGLAWSPDGKSLASTGSHDLTVRVWDAKSGQPLRKFTDFKQYAHHVIWSPDGKELIASGDTSGRVAQWKVVSGAHVFTVEHGNPVNSMAWSPDGKTLACSCTNLSVQLWELPLAQRKVARAVGETGKSAFGIAWSPDGKTLAFGSSTGKTYLWNPADGTQKTMDVGPYYLAWSPDGSTLALSSSDGAIHLFEANTGKLTKTLAREEGVSTLGIPSGIQWAADSATLAFAGPRAVAVWEVATPKRLHRLEVGNSLQMKWSPDRPVIAEIGTKTVSLWDTATLKRLTALEGHTQAVTATAWSAKSKLFATASHDKTVRIWDTNSGKLLSTLEGHTAPVSAVGWSPDGAILASAGADKTVRLWKTATAAPLRTLEGHANPVSALAWAPDGKYLATADTQVVQLWKTDTWEATSKLEVFAPIHSVAWSRGGKFLATGDENDAARVWNATTGKQREVLQLAQSPSSVLAVAWAPDSKTLATGRGAYRLQIWDVASKKLIHNLAAWAPVHYVAWSTSGQKVASCNQTSTVLFWNPLTGQNRAALVADENWMAIVSAAGHYGVTAKAESGLVYVVQTEQGQQTLEPKEFAARYRWKNVPPFGELSGK